MYEKYNAVLRFFSSKARYTVEELAEMAKGKEPASLEEKRKVVPFLQQKCGWLGLGEWTQEAGAASPRAALTPRALVRRRRSRPMRARVQVNSNGAGAVVLRARETADGVDGYVVRINTSFPDGSLTGSITRGEKAAAVRTELVATDTWADLEVDVRNGKSGATVVVSLNGVEVNRVTDPDPLPPGGLALRNDHEGTVVKFQNLRIAR